MASNGSFRVQSRPLNRLKSFLGIVFRPLMRRLTNDNRHTVLMGTFLGPLVAASVHSLVKLGVFELLQSGPKTAAELAENVDAHPQTLYRTMRALAALGYFKQHGDGAFELTPVSELLLKEHPESYQGFALLHGDVTLPNLTSFAETIRTGASVIEINHGKTFWELLEEHPDLAESFDQQMGRWTQLHAAAIVNSYDFSAARTIVDVGGGAGRMMREVLEASPQAQGIIFDRPEVVEFTRRQMDEAGLSHRCECVGGSFFDSVPEGADVYIIKHVLHDWDDEHALKILENVREAMGPDSKLLIVEGLVEHQHAPGESFRRWWDMLQLCHLLGRERTADELQSMLRRCGLRLASLQTTSLPDVLILEAAPERPVASRVPQAEGMVPASSPA